VLLWKSFYGGARVQFGNDFDKSKMSRPATLAAVVLFATLAAAQQLTITTERLTDGVEGRLYYQKLEARGGTAPYRWKKLTGSLPSGVTLDAAGLLTGIPRQAGEFSFTAQVTDASQPANSATRKFTLRVRSQLTIAWTHPPAVDNGGISGEVTVTNGTSESFDVTVIVLAVNENGRATALGYQHFALRPGEQAIPFGSPLPRGAYVVHADAIAEIARTRTIRRARLQAGPLTVP
jgi:Putative Ig domain